MKIDIFDVGHGACSVITAPNGKRIMIDCGWRRDPYWWPSIHFWGQSIDALILTNLDEDHVADFRDLRKNLRIGTIWMNDTINPARLRAMKQDGMDDGVRSVYEYLLRPTALNWNFDLSPMKVYFFRNHYGRPFTETNNLSLVTFVEYGRFWIMYPGDLEIQGWDALLGDATFRALLGRVNVFMTSHHGREDGCSEDVFKICHCRPHAFIVSDKEKLHDTQETTEWYRRRAYGLVKILKTPWDVPETRYVFTTRNDHCLSINVDEAGRFVLSINSNRQEKGNPPTSPPLLSLLGRR